MFSQNSSENDVYNTDIAAFAENLEFIERMHEPYVIIAPAYMVYAANYSELLQAHIDSGADISLLYHSVDNARESFLNCDILNLNKQKRCRIHRKEPRKCSETQYLHGYLYHEQRAFH